MDPVRRPRILPLFDQLPDCIEHSATCSLGIESWKMSNAAPPSRESWNPKALGAYYTDSQVADFMVWWAIRNPTDTVRDPSFGGGVFLRSAGKRLRDLKDNHIYLGKALRNDGKRIRHHQIRSYNPELAGKEGR